MVELDHRTRRAPLGLFVGVWVLYALVELWTSGINWQSGGAVTFVGASTAVSLGCLVWAVGVVTGSYSQHRPTYRRLMRLFGGIGIVFLGGMVVFAVR